MALPELKKPEAYRSGERVRLSCGVCGRILHETTIEELLLKKTAGRLSEAVNESDYYFHMGETGHTKLVSDHQLLVINNYSSAIIKGTVGIKLNYP